MSYGYRSNATSSYSIDSIPNRMFNYIKLRSTHTTTFDHGKVVPIFVQEVLPGDRLSFLLYMLVRLATPVKPFMDTIDVYASAFYVRNRVLFSKWKKLMGERKSLSEPIEDLVVPFVNTKNLTLDNGTLHDYLGYPTHVTDVFFSQLKNRGYNLIINEYFISNYLEEELYFNPDDDEDIDGDTYQERYNNLYTVNSKSDRFTRANTDTQAGDPVSVSLAGTVPVSGHAPVANGAYPAVVNTPGGPHVPGANFVNFPSDGSNGDQFINGSSWFLKGFSSSFGNEWLLGADFNDLHSTARVDLSASTVFQVNQLRFAFQYQKEKEEDARGGLKYFESIHTHYGSWIPDSMLERPDLLGLYKQSIYVEPVVNTTGATDITQPQGNLSAAGYLSHGPCHFRCNAEDHGYVYVMIYTKANLRYQQGLHKSNSRRTRQDYFHPVMSHIGEQPIYNQELFYDSGDGSGTVNPTNSEIFGYNEAWSEMRYGQNLITGKMRSNDPESTDIWHVARYYENQPTLTREFIIEDPDMTRIKAVASEPDYYGDFLLTMQGTTTLSDNSAPGLIDHF